MENTKSQLKGATVWFLVPYLSSEGWFQFESNFVHQKLSESKYHESSFKNVLNCVQSVAQLCHENLQLPIQEMPSFSN